MLLWFSLEGGVENEGEKEEHSGRGGRVVPSVRRAARGVRIDGDIRVAREPTVGVSSRIYSFWAGGRTGGGGGAGGGEG